MCGDLKTILFYKHTTEGFSMAYLTRCTQMGKLPMMAVCGFDEKLKRNIMSCDVMSNEKLKRGSITFLRTNPRDTLLDWFIFVP